MALDTFDVTILTALSFVVGVVLGLMLAIPVALALKPRHRHRITAAQAPIPSAATGASTIGCGSCELRGDFQTAVQFNWSPHQGAMALNPPTLTNPARISDAAGLINHSTMGSGASDDASAAKRAAIAADYVRSPMRAGIAG